MLPFLASHPVIYHFFYLFTFLIAAIEAVAFIGFFVPGTTAVVFAGFLAAHGTFSFAGIISLVALGGILGDTLSFFVGGHSKKIAWVKKTVEKHRTTITKGEAFFKKHGPKSVIIARFFAPLRSIVPFIAGLLGMDTKKFFIYNIVSGILNAIAYTSIGFFFGHAWLRYHRLLRPFEGGLIIILVVLLVGVLIRRNAVRR